MTVVPFLDGAEIFLFAVWSIPDLELIYLSFGGNVNFLPTGKSNQLRST